MPAFIATEFSYETSAKLLRLGDVPVTDKLATCDKLLSLSDVLTPPPFALLANHALFVLQPQLPSDAFTPHLADYWTILRRTLQAAKTDIHCLQDHPHNLVKAAISHVASSDPAVVQAVADALLHLSSSSTGRPFTQDLALHAALLAAIVDQLPSHPGLHPLAVWLLDVHSRLQSRSRDPRRVLSVAVHTLLRPLLVAPHRLRSLTWPLLAAAIFSVPTLSRVPLLDFIKKSDDVVLPDAVAFLLRACVRVARNAQTSQTTQERQAVGWKRSASSRRVLSSDVSRVLKFFEELIITLGESVRHERRTSKNTDVLALKIQAIASLFEVSTELDAYKPSYDAELAEASSKKPKISEKRSASERLKKNEAGRYHSGVPVSNRIQSLFIEINGMLRDFYCDKNSSQDLVNALSRAQKAILLLSLDVVEKHVPEMISTIIAGTNDISATYQHTSTRRKSFCAVVQAHRETRSLPLFFHRLRSSRLGFSLLRHLAPLLDDEDTQRTLAEAIGTLPRGQAEQCIRLMVGETRTVDVRDVPCMAFLVALVLEASNTAEFQSTWSAVREKVLPCLRETTDSVQTRCGRKYLLSSILFSINRAGLSPSEPELLESLKQSDILTACGVVDEILHDHKLGTEQKLLSAFSRVRTRDDVTEIICDIRAIAVSSHSLARRLVDGDEVTSVRNLIQLAFEAFSAIIRMKRQEPFWPGATLFHKPSPREAAVSMLASLVPLMDVFGLEGAVPSELVVFLGYAAESFSGIDHHWEELLESSSVHHALGEAMKLWLTSAIQQEDCCLTHAGILCKHARVFWLLRSLPTTYLSPLEEKEVAKEISRMYSDLCCKQSKSEAAQAVLSMGGSSFSSLLQIVTAAIQECSFPDLFKQLVQKVANGALTRDEGTKIIEFALNAVSEKKVLTTGASLLHMCTQMLRHCSSEVPMIISVLKKVVKHVIRIEQECANNLGRGTRGDRTEAVDSVGLVLNLRRSLQIPALSKERQADVEQVVENTDNFLNIVLEKAVAEAVQVVEADYSSDSERAVNASCRALLVNLCQGWPIHNKDGSAKGQRTFAMARLSALSLHFMKSESARIRGAGIQMLCTLGSNGSDDLVLQLGRSVYTELGCWSDLPQHYDGDSMSIESANELLRRFRVIEGKVVAGACVLCGFEKGSQEGVVEWSGSGEFVRFKAARKRRDLNNLRVDRETMGLIVCEILRYGGFLVGVFASLEGASMRDKCINGYQLEEMKRVTEECVLVGLEAAEICASRKAPCRLDSGHAQEILGLVCAIVQELVGKVDGERERDERVGDRVREYTGRICKMLIHQHSTTRWGVTRLLRSTLHGRWISGSSARAIGGAYEEVSKYGNREVVQCALVDVCTMLAKSGSGDVRREMMAGVAKLLSKTGMEGVQGVMVALGSEGKEVLRAVREMYAGDFQYRGK